MKIGMLTDVYEPVINGITNVIKLSKREMEALGHQVTVFTFGSHGAPPAGEPDVIRSPAWPLSDSGYYLSLSHSREARKKMCEMDVLHAHHPFISGRIATRHGRLHNLPIVFTNHTRYDLYMQAYLPLIPSSLSRMMLESYMPSFTTWCDLVIAPSAGVQKVMRQQGVEKEIVIIPNGVDVEQVHHPATCVSRTELGIPQDAIVLIYCGRLGPEKNLDFLLQAFCGAAQVVPNAYLVIIGGGPSDGQVRQSVSHTPRIRLTGQGDYDEVPAYLALGDLFVTASVSEVHPLSVIEGLAAGLPVVGIHSPGISDTVRPGLDGYLTKNDLATYTAMLVRLLLEPGKRKEMGINARERSKEFEIGATVRTTLAHYERIIEMVSLRPPKKKLWQVFGE